MKFDEFWKRIQKETEGLKLHTLARKREFTVSYDAHNDEAVVVPVSTNTPRRVPRREFARLWYKLEQVEGEPYRAKYYQRDSHNASYILALIEYFSQ